MNLEGFFQVDEALRGTSLNFLHLKKKFENDKKFRKLPRSACLIN